MNTPHPFVHVSLLELFGFPFLILSTKMYGLVFCSIKFHLLPLCSFLYWMYLLKICYCPCGLLCLQVLLAIYLEIVRQSSSHFCILSYPCIETWELHCTSLLSKRIIYHTFCKSANFLNISLQHLLYHGLQSWQQYWCVRYITCLLKVHAHQTAFSSLISSKIVSLTWSKKFVPALDRSRLFIPSFTYFSSQYLI